MEPAKASGHETILHGTSVALPGEGGLPEAVFLRGFSGSGKSDLAFRLVGDGALLIADDRHASSAGRTAFSPRAWSRSAA